MALLKDYLAKRATIDEEIVSAFDQWEDRHEYVKGDIRFFGKELYRCLQNHTSQTDWTPDVAVSLWVRINQDNNEYPEWVQPQGSHDAYQKGDKVSHLEKHWVSAIDANVYEPSVYGWDEE